MQGTMRYFLVGSGAAVTCVGRKFFDGLSSDKVFFDNSVKPVTITGVPLRQCGQAILSLEIGGGNVSLCSDRWYIWCGIFAIL